MPRGIRSAALAALLLLGLFPHMHATAEERKGQSREVQIQAARAFKEGLRIYKEGQYARGFAEMESAFAPLQAEETQRLDEFPETFSEKEARTFMMSMALGGLQVWRTRLTEIYLDHGCYRKAQALAERDLLLFDKMPDSKSDELRMSMIYRDVLTSLRIAAKGLGQLERAIELQTVILELDREFDRNPRFVASALMGLARLYQEAGDSERALRLVAEARSAFDEVWRQRPPAEHVRRSVERQLLGIEGRYDEEKAFFEEDLASISSQGGSDNLGLIGAHTALAGIYGDMGEDEKQQDALDEAFSLFLDPRPKASRNLPSLARTAFQLLRKTGRTAEANQLAEKYRLCAE